MVPTDLENQEKSGKKIVVREKSVNFIFLLKVREFKKKSDCHEYLLLFLLIIENFGAVFTNMNVHM